MVSFNCILYRNSVDPRQTPQRLNWICTIFKCFQSIKELISRGLDRYKKLNKIRDTNG